MCVDYAVTQTSVTSTQNPVQRGQRHGGSGWSWGQCGLKWDNVWHVACAKTLYKVSTELLGCGRHGLQGPQYSSGAQWEYGKRIEGHWNHDETRGKANLQLLSGRWMLFLRKC